MVDQRGERAGRRASQAITGEGCPLGRGRDDIRGEKFSGLFVVPIAINQRVDAGVWHCSIRSLGSSNVPKKRATVREQLATRASPPARRRCGREANPDMGLFDRVVIATHRVAMFAQHRQCQGVVSKAAAP
jgi:hypothetical protein